jgi:chromosome partitioning protein
MIISVAQRTGGVGKTTIAICVAAELARRGHSVDGDPQRSACQWAEPGNLEFPVYEIGLAPDQPVVGWARDLGKIKAEIVLIDTAPTEREMGASAALADIILVPCTASGLDIEATERTLRIIEAVPKRRREPMKVVLVPNRIDRRTLEGREQFGEDPCPHQSVRLCTRLCSRPIGCDICL